MDQIRKDQVRRYMKHEPSYINKLLSKISRFQVGEGRARQVKEVTTS
jgi:hypothetical protein